MTITSFERQQLVLLRDMQLERRRFETSWDEVAHVDNTIGPTLDIKYSKLAHNVEVARWRSGNPRLGSANFETDTDDIRLAFYGSSLTQSWWEKWLKQNATQQPNAALFPENPQEFFNMRLALQKIVDSIERAIDDDFYGGGHDGLPNWDGIVNIDDDPQTLTSDLSTEAGREEFLSTIREMRVTAKNPPGDDRRVMGQLTLAIDSALTPFLDEPRNLASGNQRTVREYLVQQLGGDNIVEVENSELTGKAVLHWKDKENIVTFNGTPKGVELLTNANPNTGADDHAKIFYIVGWHEFRDDSVRTMDGLAPA